MARGKGKGSKMMTPVQRPLSGKGSGSGKPMIVGRSMKGKR